VKESRPIETYTGETWIPALDGASRKKLDPCVKFCVLMKRKQKKKKK
jgi:hypothetical protein